jgi:hypothetical protein
VALLGVVTGAPVPTVSLVSIPADMLPSDEPPEAAGLGHALHYLGPDLVDDGIDHVPGNEARFGALIAFYTWLGTPRLSEYQLSFQRLPDATIRLFSVDHGAFLQPANGWNAHSLEAAGVPRTLDPWCMRSNVAVEWLRDPAMRMEQCTPMDVARAARSVPESWGISDEERIALCRFAWSRRSATLLVLREALG